MKMNLETYINYLHSLHALLRGLEEHPLCQETIDSYYDLNPMDSLDDLIEIFDYETKMNLIKLDNSFLEFIKARKLKKIADYNILEKSTEWVEVKMNASMCLNSLNKYLKSMGVIPESIFRADNS